MEMTTKYLASLKETNPHGPEFTQSFEKVLKSYDHWSKWISEGCPDFIAQIVDEKPITYKRSQIDAYDPTLLDLSNQELTRLWKISINNLDACKSDSRNFQSNQSGFELASDV